MQTRILICANSYFYLRNFRERTIRALVSEGYDVTIAAFGSRNDWAGLRGANFICRHENSFYVLLSIVCYIVRNRDVCVLSFTPIMNALLSSLRFVISFQLYVNISGRGVLASFTGLRQVIGRFIESTICKADYIFFQNRADFLHYSQLSESVVRKSQVIPGSGVDITRFQPPANYLKRRKIIYSGRLLVDKGVNIFIDAAELFKAMNPNTDIFFEIYGQHVNNSRYIDLLEYEHIFHKGNVRYCGFTSDVPSVLENTLCVCLPSRYAEGTPRSLLEGLAAGCLIVTGNTPGCMDTVNCGKNGWAVDVSIEYNLQVKKLAEIFIQISHLSEQSLASMGRHSRDIAVTKYDERLAIEPYLELIRARRSLC